MIRYLLKHQPPEDPEKEVIVKFAFDGGTMTGNRKRKQEHGTLQIIEKADIHEAKSHFNTHQWLIYLGDEEYETLKSELENAIPEIDKLIEKKEVG